MANPLKSFMGGGTNPLGGMMNPQNMLMNMLKQRNPQMFSQINQMMNSGVNPNDFMKQMGVTPQQMEMAKQAQSANIISTLQPTAKPAYLTCSPYYAYNSGACFGNGCGCNGTNL